jgi:hypothetical protein
MVRPTPVPMSAPIFTAGSACFPQGHLIAVQSRLVRGKKARTVTEDETTCAVEATPIPAACSFAYALLSKVEPPAVVLGGGGILLSC